MGSGPRLLRMGWNPRQRDVIVFRRIIRLVGEVILLAFNWDKQDRNAVSPRLHPVIYIQRSNFGIGWALTFR